MHSLLKAPNKHALNINRPIFHSVACFVWFFGGFLSVTWGGGGGGVACSSGSCRVFARWRNRWEKLARGGWIPVRKEGDSRAWPPTCPPHTSPSLSLRPPRSLVPPPLQPSSLFFSLICLSCRPVLHLPPLLSCSSSFLFSLRGGFGHQSTCIRAFRAFTLVGIYVMGRVWEGAREAGSTANPSPR